MIIPNLSQDFHDFLRSSFNFLRREACGQNPENSDKGNSSWNRKSRVRNSKSNKRTPRKSRKTWISDLFVYFDCWRLNESEIPRNASNQKLNFPSISSFNFPSVFSSISSVPFSEVCTLNPSNLKFVIFQMNNIEITP